MAFSHILWFWVLATSVHGACEADKYTKEWVQKYPSETSTTALNGVLFANDRFLAYGGKKKILSTDGETWEKKYDSGWDSVPKIYGATYYNGFILVGFDGGSGKIHQSDNGGEGWYASTNMEFTAYAIAFGGGKYIIGGDSMSKKATYNIGADNSWSTVNGPEEGGDWKIYDIIYTNQFVGCGNGIYTSDGNSWVRRYTPANNLNAIAYGNGIYVAVGDQGTIVRSTDSITWTDQSLTVATPGDLWGVAFGSKKFIVVNSAGKMYASKDGITWTAQTNSPASISLGNPGFSNHLAFGKGQFVVVGSSDLIYVAADNCTCDLCSECSTVGDCTGNKCLWYGTSSSCVESCSTSKCSSCPNPYSCNNKGDACTWNIDSASCSSGYVFLHIHWAWCLMICLSIILLH